MAVRAQARAAIFLDKDGTLLENVPSNVQPERIRWSDGAEDGVRAFSTGGFRLFIVSNQSGVARGFFPEEALGPVRRSLAERFDSIGAPLDGFYYCPHHPDASVPRYRVACLCRKPGPGLLLRAALEHGIDLAASWMIGDILDDVEAGRRAGCRTILIGNGNETEWLFSPERIPDRIATDLRHAARLVEIEGARRPRPALGGRHDSNVRATPGVSGPGAQG
ncbi:MAG: D-glycero-alpha-D-manno-heptose-1,7-bisphosphate 7-phosphatase [Candidatus Eisenbacteria bacterium]